MENIKDIIRNRRKELGLTLLDVAKSCNVSEATVSRWESGDIGDMKRSRILSLSKVLKIPTSVIIGDYEEEKINTYNNLYKLSKQSLPMLGSIACGVPIYADEERESYVMCGTDIKADFCLRCQGDSMINARINDGDIVFIRKQDAVNNGEIAAVIIEDEATLKRFFYYKEQGMVILRAENPKYKDIVLTGEQLNSITIFGKAIAFQSDVE